MKHGSEHIVYENKKRHGALALLRAYRSNLVTIIEHNRGIGIEILWKCS